MTAHGRHRAPRSRRLAARDVPERAARGARPRPRHPRRRVRATPARRTSPACWAGRRARSCCSSTSPRAPSPRAPGMAIGGRAGACVLGVAAVVGHTFPIYPQGRQGRRGRRRRARRALPVDRASGSRSCGSSSPGYCTRRRSRRCWRRFFSRSLYSSLGYDRWEVACRRRARGARRRPSPRRTSAGCSGARRTTSARVRADERRASTAASEERAMTRVRKAVIPAAGLGTRFLPGDEELAQGDAAGRRQARDPVRRRRGRAGRAHRHPDHHRSQQARDRGPLRPQLRARALPRQRGQARPARRKCSSRPTSPTSTTSASAIRSVSGTRCRSRVITSATSRSRCCSPTTSWSTTARCCVRCSTCTSATDRSVRRVLRKSRPRRSRRTAASIRCRPVDAPVSADGVVEIRRIVEKPPRDEAPSNLAMIGRYVFTPEIFDDARPHRARHAAASCSSPTRSRCCSSEQKVFGLHVPARPLRRRAEARLPARQHRARARPRPISVPRSANGCASTCRALAGLTHARVYACGVIPLAEAQSTILDAVAAARAAPVRARATRAVSCSPRTSSRASRFRRSPTPAWTATRCARPTRPGIACASSASCRPGARRPIAVGPGEAIRIMTGAPMPDGADAVVMVERTRVDGDDVVVEVAQLGRARAPGGRRRRGRRSRVRARARCSRPRTSACSRASTCTRCACHPRPRVGVISTGDELVERGPLAPGPHPRLEPSDAARAASRSWAAKPVDGGIVGDDERRDHRGRSSAWPTRATRC